MLVGVAHVLGRWGVGYDDAKTAAEAAATAWNVPLSSLVRTSGAKRAWTATDYNWIWQRGIQKYVLRRKWEGKDFTVCSTNLDELVSLAMNKWDLTMAEMKKIPGGADDEVPPARIPGVADEEEVPATQFYPEDVLSLHGVPEGHAADQEDYQRDSDDDNRLPTNVNWGAAKFVSDTLAADPHMLPGDIADLEGRATGLASK